MRYLVILAAALALAACHPVPEQNERPAPAATRTSGAKVAQRVYKYCDMGRAVYVMDEVYAAAIAIVENAPECPD